MIDLKIFSGRSNEPLAAKIAEYIACEYDSSFHLGKLGRRDTPTGNFPDGEPYTRYLENLRGIDVFLIQSTNQPHENDEELRN